MKIKTCTDSVLLSGGNPAVPPASTDAHDFKCVFFLCRSQLYELALVYLDPQPSSDILSLVAKVSVLLAPFRNQIVIITIFKDYLIVTVTFSRLGSGSI